MNEPKFEAIVLAGLVREVHEAASAGSHEEPAKTVGSPAV